ncbi:MAG TPA: T9SS type A sorting domain-containing protein [Saprospiraceae bacterium]|nr:T9SS type A sorting domain-containing protein [Saprospiraceae bacterium]
MIIKSITISFVLMITNAAFSQAYVVKITSEPYDSLTQYESLSNNGVDLYFTKTAFELPWNFPFFDEEYKLLYNSENSTVSFDTESSHTFYPMYLFDSFWGRYYLEPNSDYRYGKTSPDNVCFEWRNVGSFTGIFDKFGERGLATFKTCFWKNGDIDLHFDELSFDENLFDTVFIYENIKAPTYIALTNPKDENEAVILSTDPSNPFILDKWDFFNTEKPPFIKKLPPTDLKIRFSLRRSSTENASFKPFKIPNPVSSEIVIPDDFQYDGFTIINNNAALVISGKQTPSIDVQNLSQGVYFLLLKDGMVHYKYKFIKL